MHEEHFSHFDAIVIGGGPAGAATAIRLASLNRSVLLLEREKFPRFHIGESLLPYHAKLLEKMGLFDKILQGDFVIKRGAEFTGTSGQFRRVDFITQGPGRKEYTFQVERAIFDELLLQFARESGAEVIQEANVTNLLMEGDRVVGVRYKKKGSEYAAKARFVVDASGRSGKIANKFKLRKMNKRLKMVAVFRHFGNLDESKNPGVEGDIQIGNHEDGWIWAIPIHRDVISVGVVTSVETLKKSSPEEVFVDHLKRVPRIVQRLEGTVPLTEVNVESDFCYHAEKLTGPGYFIVGDAACFVDPIFSAGVYLGQISGIKAAEAIHEILSGKRSEEQAQTHYENFAKTGFDCYFRLIYAFYESNFNFGRYVQSIPFAVERKWIARLLSGDFWSPHNPLTRYMRTVERWNTFEEPFEFVYGCPVYGDLDLEEMKNMQTAI